VSVIENFYASGGSCVTLEREYHREFSVHVAPSRGTMNWIIKLSEKSGSLCVTKASKEARIFFLHKLSDLRRHRMEKF
jgi:hypothetical protein